MEEKHNNPNIDWSDLFNHQVPSTVGHLQQALASLRRRLKPHEGKWGTSRFHEIFYDFEFDLSSEAADFLVRLADLPENANVLFPRNDIGTLAYCIRQRRPDVRLTFWSDDVDIGAYHSFVFPDHNVTAPSDLMELAKRENGKFDLIIGGILDKSKWRARIRSLGRARKRERTDATTPDTFLQSRTKNYDDMKFLAALSKLLKDRGKLISDMWEPHVDERFLEERSKLRQWLRKLGTVSELSVDAAIEDIEGLDRWGDVIMIQSKSPQGRVFSAQYSGDEPLRETIVSGFLRQSSAKRAHAGFWSSLESYEPNGRLRHLEQVRGLAEQAGLSPFRFKEIIGKREPEDSPHRENILHISQWRCDIDKGQSDYILPVEYRPADSDKSNWVEVPIDQSKALAEYIALFLNESELGQLIAPDLTAGTSDTLTFHPSEESILECELWLPDIRIQEEVIRNQNELFSIRSEIDEIASLQWRDPRNVKEVRKMIKQVNTEQSFVTWIDQLPFPLASVLWTYHAECRTEKEKYKTLLLFFEALAEFLCIIHLSALYPPTSNLWLEFKKRVKESKRRINLKETTFGRWTMLLELLSGFARDGIRNDAVQDELLYAYKLSRAGHIAKLSNRSILAALEFAKEFRNEDDSHGGAMGERQAGDIHQRLLFSLKDIRDPITEIWEYYDLVMPGSGKYSAGEYVYQGKRIWGTRIPFEEIEFNTVEPLEADRLHLVSRMTNKAIKLLPFMQVVPGPKTRIDACYLFSKIDDDPNKAKFISYHFAEDNKFYPTVSPEIWEVINAL